eukprot:scaffold189928_cov21-Tisochrysis_lutea.AAC.1
MGVPLPRPVLVQSLARKPKEVLAEELAQVRKHHTHTHMHMQKWMSLAAGNESLALSACEDALSLGRTCWSAGKQSLQ